MTLINIAAYENDGDWQEPRRPTISRSHFYVKLMV